MPKRFRKSKKIPFLVPRGLVPPGYKYLGPGNSLNIGKATNPTDRAAELHDVGYQQLLANGKRPYTTYNIADEEFLKRIKLEGDYGATIARSLFNLKRKAADFGFISSDIKHPRLTTQLAEQAFQSMMAEGKGSGNEAGTKETPVDPVINVGRGPPDYTYASLPFYNDLVERPPAPYYTHILAYRMTSPYDTTVGYAATDANAGAGATWIDNVNTDTADATSSKARWFDMYAGLYDYYHVVGARWRVTFENLSTQPVWIHQMYGNEECPPPLATNEDIRCWKGVYSHYVGTTSTAILSTGNEERNDMVTGDNDEDVGAPGTYANQTNYENGNQVTSRGRGPVCIMQGSYRTGDYKNEIHQDALIENWTAVTANPKLSERLYFFIKGQGEAQALNDANTYGNNLQFRWNLEIEYLVEFKQLKTALRWPVQRQPVTITLNSTTTSTN